MLDLDRCDLAVGSRARHGWSLQCKPKVKPHLDVSGVDLDCSGCISHSCSIVLKLDVSKGTVCIVDGIAGVQLNRFGIALDGLDEVLSCCQRGFARVIKVLLYKKPSGESWMCC